MQAQAIRTANKLWLNDPIQLRKSLYIPLEACTQPPSKEYEFVQKAGEDVLHLFHRQTTVGEATASSLASPPRFHERSRSRMRSGSLLQAALSLDRPLTPYHDESPSEQSSARSSFSFTRSAVPLYLAETNSDYGDSSDDLPSGSSRLSEFGSGGPGSPPPGSTGLPMAMSPVPVKASLIEKGTLQIVRMPSQATGAQKGKGRAPTLSHGREEPDVQVIDALPANGKRRNSRDTVQAISSGSLLTPSSSSDRLSSLVPGLSVQGNLRMRPRSPFDGDSVDPTTPNMLVSFPDSAGGTSSNKYSPHAPPASAFPPPRTRKISKDADPTSARQSSGSAAPPSAAKTFSYFGQLLTGGVSSSGKGGSLAQQGKSWLGVSDFEDEIELARAYQDNRLRKVSSAGSREGSQRQDHRRTSRN